MPETNKTMTTEMAPATTPTTTNTATQQPHGSLVSFYDGNKDAINWAGYAILALIGIYLVYRWYNGSLNVSSYNKR